MKRAVSVVLFYIFCLFVYAQPEVPRFSDMDWGIDKNAVKTRMAERGYIFQSDIGNEYSLFSGNIFGSRAVIAMRYIDKGLARIVIAIKPPEVDLISSYQNAVRELNNKYGACENYDKFSYPYTMGDGKEVLAISIGKGSLLSVWNIISNNMTYSIAALVEQDMKLQIWYESPKYTEYMEKNAAENDL